MNRERERCFDFYNSILAYFHNTHVMA